jgi:hypothetical protein
VEERSTGPALKNDRFNSAHRDQATTSFSWEAAVFRKSEAAPVKGSDCATPPSACFPCASQSRFLGSIAVSKLS